MKTTDVEEGDKRKKKSSLLEGMLGLWGVGSRKKRSRKWGGCCSFTSTRLEPQWLARIQPHSGFDEGWILKLNQSHMSPTERASGRQTGLRDRERDGGGGRHKSTEGGMEDRKGEKRQETVDVQNIRKGGGVMARGERKVIKKPTSGYG